jgi:hypothetical protein|tara:strand:- start:407 stop:604 length:198 start_codon:yes stop_codon:yes gene_type:complete
MEKFYKVIKELVESNPNNMQLGELVRQYVNEYEAEMTCNYSGLASLKSYKEWPIPLKVVKRKEFK